MTEHKREKGTARPFRGEGFTMVEVVVVLSIITIISTVVLVSFTGLNESGVINRSGRELALGVRRAQNMSLAVTQISVGSPPTNQIPPAVGVRFSTLSSESNSFFLFADLDPRDNKYTDASEKIIDSTVTFERAVKINKISSKSGQQYSIAHIIFTAPEATAALTDQDGGVIPGGEINVELISPSGNFKKTVSVRESGQIVIK